MALVPKNGEDRIALSILQSLVGEHPERHLLAVIALDRISSIYLNIKQLDRSINPTVRSGYEGFLDEVLQAVEVVMKNK